MPKDYHIDDFIVKELENGGLTGKELRDRFNKREDLEKPEDMKRTFGDAFHRLLFDGIIKIDGYYNEKRFKWDPKFNSKEISEQDYKKNIRNRTLNWYDLIYSLVLIEPIEITILINQLTGPEKGVESYNELKKLFYNKMQEIYDHNCRNSEDELSPFDIQEVYEIFDNVISYINSIETGKAALIQRLSIGLSNKKESLNVLDELIEESYYMEHGES